MQGLLEVRNSVGLVGADERGVRNLSLDVYQGTPLHAPAYVCRIAIAAPSGGGHRLGQAVQTDWAFVWVRDLSLDVYQGTCGLHASVCVRRISGCCPFRGWPSFVSGCADQLGPWMPAWVGEALCC